jgi:uncharacterized protein YidB (DUF937 family)
MGFLDGILAQVTGATGGANPQQAGLVATVLAIVQSQPGGLTGLVQRFQQHGLQDVIASWITTGPNQSITPAQVHQVLGEENVQQIAQQHGLDATQVTSQLSQILPTLVDKLTPNGELPEGAGALGDLLKGFGAPR